MPQPPVVVFIEQFENVSTPTVAVFLDDYTGPSPLSMTYTANPAWISGPACNGLLVSWNSGPGTTGCSSSVYNTFVRPIARALGNQFGGGDDNQAMADVTVSGFPAPPTPAATLETVSPVPLPSSNRFIAFSIDVGVTTCASVADPLLRFFLVDGTTEISVNNDPINPCTAPGGTSVPGGAGGIRIGTFATDGSILFAGTSIGVKLTNDQTSGSGNDYAVDNIRLLDATPQLDKAFGTDFVEVGTPVALTFTVTNTSELAAKEGWSFQDALPPGLAIADPANATTDCTNGIVTASPGGGLIAVSGDLDTGQAFCTASVDVTSADPVAYENGPDDVFDLVGLDPPGTAEVTFVVTGLSLEKAGSGPDPVTVGATIDYTFVVTNTGTAELTNVTVGDPLPGLSPIACPGTTLAPTESMTCTATYTVSQGDADAGFVVNTATVTGEPSGGAPVSDQDTAVVPPSQEPGISIEKSGSAPEPPGAGDSVQYSFLVTNTGNVTLSDVTVTDPLPGLSPISCPATTLAPDESMTCTAAYAVTQPDLDAGSVENTATVTGDPPGILPQATDESAATVPLSQLPAIDLSKTGSGPDPLTVGATIDYAFEVTNTGNVTLMGVTVTDPLPGLSSILCPGTVLAPGESMTCTAGYTVTQDDADAGFVQNTATVTGVPPGTLPQVSDEDSTTVPPSQLPGIQIDKSGTGPDPLVVGATVAYSFLVVNTGNVTLTGVTVTDPFPGLSPIDCPGTVLAPAESMTCTAGYTVDQDDVDAGVIENTATATGDPPGELPQVSAQDTASVPPTQQADLELDKSGIGPDPLTVGAPVVYTFVIENTGNVTLTEVTVSDPLPGLSAIDCPGTVLAPGAQMTCTASYVVTQADVDERVILNTATATAEDGSGGVVSDQGTASVPSALSILEIPALSRVGALLLILLLSAVALRALRGGLA